MFRDYFFNCKYTFVYFANDISTKTYLLFDNNYPINIMKIILYERGKTQM